MTKSQLSLILVRSLQKQPIKRTKKFEDLITQMLKTKLKPGRRIRTNVIAVVEKGIRTMEQNMDGKNIARQRMQHVSSAKKLDILPTCRHVDPKKFHVSRLKLSTALDPQILSS